MSKRRSRFGLKPLLVATGLVLLERRLMGSGARNERARLRQQMAAERASAGDSVQAGAGRGGIARDVLLRQAAYSTRTGLALRLGMRLARRFSAR
jgi:hypothetical protein